LFVQIRDHVLTAPFDNCCASDQLEGQASTSRRSEDWRKIGLGAQILCDLGVRSIRLLAAHHRHYVGLGGFGIEIVTTDILD
jgi:3,4-dihydroxy 2-butanone 4-phosphate synthase/GTP cyclohydrolase II